jgi:hypothetical protein
MSPGPARRFFYAPISRDQWLRICSLARLWDSDTDSASERIVERALDVIEAEEGETLKRCDALWKARFALRRRLGDRPL